MLIEKAANLFTFHSNFPLSIYNNQTILTTTQITWEVLFTNLFIASIIISGLSV